MRTHTNAAAQTRSQNRLARLIDSWPFNCLILAGAILAAYGGSLGSWFNPIDDPIHLSGALQGVASSPHFRPIHQLWIRGLWAVFHDNPFGWRAASLLVHFGSSLLLVSLLRALRTSRSAALFGALTFALCFAPNEAVAWNSAACGLLSVFFVLACARLWLAYLEGHRAVAFVGTCVALALAVGSKEDAVLAGPLLIGLDLIKRGPSKMLKPKALASYLPFVLIAALFFWRAFRPELWSERSDVGSFSLGVDSIGKWVATPAILLWPHHLGLEHLPSWMPAGGALSSVVFIGFAWRQQLCRKIAMLGLVIILAGILPAVLGPWAAPASSRYGYPSAIGLGFIAAAAFEVVRGIRLQSFRLLGLALGSVWLLFSAYAIRSTISWRFVQPSLSHRTLVMNTRENLSNWSKERSEQSVLLVNPGLWNPDDFACDIIVFARKLDLSVGRLDLPVEGIRDRLLEMVGTDSTLVLIRGEQGLWEPLTPSAHLPIELWNEQASQQTIYGKEGFLACIRVGHREAGDS